MASNPYDTLMGSLIRSQQGITEQKQERLQKASEEKKRLLAPNRETFDPDLYDVIDGDTIRHRRTGESVRIGGQDGYHEDSFESYTRAYDNDPVRFDRHRRNYAKLYGKDPEDVSKEDLVLVGKVQKARLQNTLPKMRGMGLNKHKTDDYGRTVASFDDMSAFEQTRDTKGGASYTSPFNYAQKAADIASGDYNELIAPKDRSVLRAVTGDFASNVGTGALKAANSLVHGVVTLLPGQTPKPLDDFFVNNQERLEKLQKFLTSDAQTFRQKMDQKESALNEEIYDVRRQEYKAKGLSDQQAKISAGYDEFKDRLEYLIENPGQMLDATAESLPYMLGVGAVGRIAVNSAVKSLTKQALKGATKKGLTGEAAQVAAAARMQAFQTSKHGQALLKKVADRSAVTSVGITEGFTNASDAYISVIGMDEEQAMQSEKYRALRAAGQSHEDALATLGEGVFLQTLLTTAAVAGVASKVTGAASFEGNLFRRGVTAEAATKAARKLKGGAVLRGAQRAALAGGRYARFAGTPGLREAGEEAIQSGGGEFLSQLAQFNQGLIDEVGPGVGRATGEGAAVGFVSGAGAQTVIGGAKKLADKDLRASGVELLDRNQRVRSITDKTGVPGGSKAKAQRSARKITPEKAVTDLNKLAAAWDKSDSAALEDLAKRKADIDIMMEAAESTKDGITPAVQEMYDAMRSQYVTALDRAAQDVLKREKPANSRSAKEKKILQEAVREDVPGIRSNESLGRVYEHTRAAVDAIEQQTKETIEGTAAAVEAGIERRDSERVAREKMGRGENKNGLPGLMGHFDRISEAITNNDTASIESRFEALNNFINSQRRKLQRLTNFLQSTEEQQAKNKEFSYKKNTTERYYDTLHNELETMREVHGRLSSLYDDWSKDKKADIPSAPAAPKKRDWNPKGDTAKAEPKKTESKPAEEGRKRNWNPKGQKDEESTQSKPAEDDVGQSSPDTGTGAETASDTETSAPVEPVDQGTEGTPESASTESQERASETAEQTASDVTEEVAPVEDTPLRKLRGKNQRYSVTVENGTGVKDRPSYIAVAEFNFAGTAWIVTRPYGYKTGWQIRHAETGLSSSQFPVEDTIDAAYKAGLKVLQRQGVEAVQAAVKTAQKKTGQEEPVTEQVEEPLGPTDSEIVENRRETIEHGIFEEKNVVTALTRIAAFSDVELFAQLAQRLMEVLEGRDIKIKIFNDKDFDAYMKKHGDAELASNPPSAAYLGQRQEIVLRQKYRNHPNLEQAFLHEATHAAINGWMTKPKKSATEKALHERAYKLRNQILKELKKLVRDNPGVTHYAETLHRLEENKEEWIAYAWSNNQTQLVLHEIKMGMATGLRGFLNIIKDILGLEGRTALDHTLQVSDKIFERNVGKKGRSAREGVTHTPSANAVQQAKEVRKLLDRQTKLTGELEIAEEEDPTSGKVINLRRRLQEIEDKLSAFEDTPAQPEATAAVEEAEGQPTPDEVEPEVRAQAEAQPERSAGTEGETATTETNDQWWDSYNEVQRLQARLRDGSLTEEQIRFPIQRDQRQLEKLVAAGNTVTSALAQMESQIEELLDKNIPRTEIPTDYLNMEEVVQAATQLTKKGETTATANPTEGASDFTHQSNWERIRKWILGSYDRANILDVIRDAFAARQIPTSIENGFEQAREKARSLITAVPNLHDVLANPKGRRQLYDALGLTPEEEMAFDAFAEFRDEIEQALDESAFQELVRDKVDYRDGNRIAQNPAYLLTDETEALLPAVITAIAYESMNWIAGDGSRLYNDSETIARILGLPDGAEPTAAQSRLRTAGTLRRNVVDSLGSAIWRHLNLKAKQSPNIAPNIEERMMSALGTLALRALQVTQPPTQRGKPGRVQAVTFEGTEFRNMKGLEATEHEDYSKPVSFIRATALSQRGSNRFLLSNANAYLQEDIRPGRTVFNRVFGVSNVIKEPLTEAPTEENIPRKALRSLTVLSKKMRAAIKFQQSREWTANTRLIDKLRQFTPEQYLKLAHELEDNMSAVHDLELDNVEGRNRTLLTAFENALEWGTRRGDSSLWFTYSMTRTGRTMIDSTYINPQQSKIHRFLFGQKAWQETIQPGDTELLENFKIAVAQGMGIKVDKMTREDILAALDARMEKQDVQEALEDLARKDEIDLETTNEAGETTPTSLGSILKEEGTHTLAALMAWQDYLDAAGGTFTTNLPVEVDGVTNGFAAGLLQTPPVNPAAMTRLKDLLRAVGVFFTEDEEQSFAEWLKDPSNKDNYQTAARKTAEAISRMMPGGDIFQSLDAKEDIDRFYMVIGEEMGALLASGFGPTEQDLRDPKVGRDFAKNPLMIVAYGASSKTVANNLVENIWIKAHRQMADVNRMVQEENESDTAFEARQVDALLKVLNRYVDVSNIGKEALYEKRRRKFKKDAHFTKEEVYALVKDKAVKDRYGDPVTSIQGLAQSWVFKDDRKASEYYKSNFVSAMKATYGRGIEVALAEMLEGIREIRDVYTQTITMMNAIFAIDFQRRVNIEEAATNRVVGRARRRAIVTRMHHEGLVPSIATAYSNPNNLAENLELTAWQHNLINDQNVKILHDDVEGVTRIHYGDGTVEVLGDTKSTTNNLTARDPSTDVGVAGVVGTIHSLDGTNSADIFGSFDVLNMFDAWIMRLSDMGTTSSPGGAPNQGNNRFYNQHREYDMGQELLKSMERMLVLIRQGDGRLTPADRRAAGNLLISQLEKLGRWDEEMADQYTLEIAEDGTRIYDSEQLMEDFANDMRNTANTVSEAREELFQLIGRTDQFSNDKTSYEVPESSREEPLPGVNDTQEAVEKHARHVASAEKVTAKAETLAQNLDQGDFNKAFFNWLQEEQVRPSEALRVLNELIQITSQGLVPTFVAQAISDLASVLHQYADNTKVILVGKLDDGQKGRFQNRQIILDDTQFTEEDSPVETLLHEIVHAATHEALENLEENNPDLLDQIYDRGVALYKRLKTRKNLNRQQLEFVAAIDGQLRARKDRVIMTGEYLAYVQSSISSNETGQLYLALGTSGDFLTAFRAMGQLLTQGNTQTVKLRSSKDKVNNKLFDEQEGQKLESQKLWDNYEAMEELDASTDAGAAKEYREFIQHIMDGVLLPGLASLTNALMIKLGVQPDATKNIGEVERGSDADVLKVQSAGAKLTNSGDMSNQEVFAHELFHAVTGFTIATDTKVRAELRKIYEFARDNLTWEHFMPAEDDIAGDRAAVEQAAKDRYDYIFGQVEFDSEGNPKVDQLQEFAAIGLTNKPLALALSRIDAPSAAEPLWDGHILSFLVNLVQRGLEMLRGYTLGTRRAQNSADALFKLSQQIVTINKQAQARKWDKKRHEGLWRNSIDQRASAWVQHKLDKAQRKLRLTEEEKHKNGSVKQWIRMGTHAALAQRTDAQQKANAEFMRHLGVNKASGLAETISEILPYNKDDRGGADGKMGFLDLLRHSKVQIDIARQRAIEHTRSVLMDSFDKKRPRTRGQRLALTNVILRTDMHSLMLHNEKRTHRDLHQMLKNDALVTAEIARLERELAQELKNQGASSVMTMYQRQIDSLANYMTRGVMTEDNGMKNAHSIVRQYNLWLDADRVKLKDPKTLDPIVDQLATLRAMQLTTPSDKDLALQVIDREMAREDDNGFFYMLGMAGNYKSSSLRDLFNNNPVQMRKGYVYDITDGDRNIEVVFDTPAEVKRMEDLGMIRIGRVQEDRHDRSAPQPRVMYKGYRGASTWQKATVSLTSTQRQGTSLFEVSGFNAKKSRQNLGRMLSAKHREAMKQFKVAKPQNYPVIAIPVLDDRGAIVDYTYEMSLAAKQQHLKNTRNNDYFDMVIPRMFGAIPDRTATKKINGQAAELIYKEYEAFKDSPEHNFAKIGKYSNRRGKDMWNVIPDDMKRELGILFRGTEFVDGKGRLVALPLRDEAVNLVLGFRKLSILDLEVGGKRVIRGKNATFAARTAERVWQEIMQLVRIKMAIINPQVVVGNISSNFGILLAEGIPAKYIQAKTSEAIRSMRQYQRDVRRVDELQRHIGARTALESSAYLSPGVKKMITERERLKAELRANSVGYLVEEGLFTSIVEDVTSDEDTYREWIVGSALDKVTGTLPSKAVQLAKEAYMVPGSNAFNMAIAATQYGDFIGRYVKFKYDTEVKGTNQKDAINAALASFIYYDMPQNRWMQLLNDNGFVMFTKFFLRIQPVIAKMFQENPVKATGVLAMQQALMNPFDENIGTFALFQGIDNRFFPMPLAHVEKLEPTNPSLFQWFGFLGL